MSISYGTSIVIDDTVNTPMFNIPFKNNVTKRPYPLQGSWLKVKYSNQEGYIFSGFLSKMPCFKKDKNRYSETIGIGRTIFFEDEEDYLKRIYGKPKIIVKKSIVRNQPLVVTTKKYKNDVVEIISEYDGCPDVSLYLNNISYQDALLFEEIWMDQGDAVEDIKIKMLPNGKVRFSYYSCD